MYLSEKLKLGNLQIRRDWGWASEYVFAMWKMLNLNEPEDFVISTGRELSLEEFIIAVFDEAKLNWKEHVISDPTILRPSDPKVSCGNPSKAKKLLNWQASIIGEDVPRKMYRES